MHATSMQFTLPFFHQPLQLPHNTNASQFWLCANLPEEPPTVMPSSISGPALITADDIK